MVLLLIIPQLAILKVNFYCYVHLLPDCLGEILGSMGKRVLSYFLHSSVSSMQVTTRKSWILFYTFSVNEKRQKSFFSTRKWHIFRKKVHTAHTTTTTSTGFRLITKDKNVYPSLEFSFVTGHKCYEENITYLILAWQLRIKKEIYCRIYSGVVIPLPLLYQCQNVAWCF